MDITGAGHLKIHKGTTAVKSFFKKAAAFIAGLFTLDESHYEEWRDEFEERLPYSATQRKEDGSYANPEIQALWVEWSRDKHAQAMAQW